MVAPQRSLCLRSRLLGRIIERPSDVWTPGDFADLAGRDAVDKALQRLAAAEVLCRIDRGLYSRPSLDCPTGRPTVPDHRAVLRAVARRDKLRFVVDGMTAASDLGLINAVPARIEVLVDARLRPIRLGNQQICFKAAASSRLYWADRPAMRVVQALYWLRDILKNEGEGTFFIEKLRRLIADPDYGASLNADLLDGLSALPIWMQEIIRPLVTDSSSP